MSAAAMMHPKKAGDAGLVLLGKVLAANKDNGIEPQDWAGLGPYLGISKQAVDHWKRIPQEHVFRFEKEFGIPRYVARPDIYPPPAKAGPFRVVSGRSGARVRLAKVRRG